jgi:hypothetical protein
MSTRIGKQPVAVALLTHITIWVALLAGATLFYAVFIARTAFVVDGTVYFSLFDDAMISMRYAQHLAGGSGLVWNNGAPPVEGYTNSLWTAWMAVVHILPTPESKRPLVIMITAGTCLLLASWIAGQIAQALAPRANFAAFGAAALSAFYYPLTYWSLRGMEVGFLALLTLTATLLTLRLTHKYDVPQVWGLAIVLAASLLTRLDAIITVFVITVFAAFHLPRTNRIHFTAIVASMSILALAGQTVFRALYFGDILPNAYYLKLTGTPLLPRIFVGGTALLTTCAEHFWLLIPLLMAIVLRTGCRIVYDRRSLLVFLFAAQCAYSVYVGGDFLERLPIANRYIAIGMPAVFIFMSVSLLGFDFSHRVTRLWMAGGLACGLAVFLLNRAVHLESGMVWPGKSTILMVFGLVAVLWACVSISSYATATQPALARVIVVLLFVSLNGDLLIDWAHKNAMFVDSDEEMARLGLEIRRRTPPDTTIAVVWAGAPPYWSERNSVDLLGKNDPVIARTQPRGVFRPGHNKWNYEYSIETYRPDVILQTWGLTDTDRAYLHRMGYRRAANGMYLDERSVKIDQSLLEEVRPPMRHPGEER